MLFTKMHGLGNSFVLFNELDFSLEIKNYKQLAQSVSDVNFGVGADGIILIGWSNIANYRMRIFNQDGSEGKNCGNGLRCVAKYLYDHNYVSSTSFTIETLGGVVAVSVELDSQSLVEYVTVDMGEPKLQKAMIPMEGDPDAVTINEQHIFSNKKYDLTCLSMGNPHAIIFVDDISEVVLAGLGPIIEHSTLFPERVNVGVVKIKSHQEICYRVWERGSGITMACGTGACAAVVAATLNNLLDKHLPITVSLLGGDLTVRWDEKGHVWQRGGASYICSGELESGFNCINEQ